jgi:hypothetical protein
MFKPRFKQMKTLEKIVKTAKGVLLTGLLTAIAGCVTYVPITSNKRYDEEMYSEAGARLNLIYAPVKVNLSKEKRTIPVHPDDGGASKGGVVINLNEVDAASTVRANLGLEGSIGTEYIRFKAGGDIKLNPQGVEHRELQPLPFPYESYGCARLTSETLTFAPFIGVDVKLKNNWRFGIELGAPYDCYRVEKWHYRFDQNELTEKDSWRGYGTSFRVMVSYGSDDVFIGFGYGQEIYPVKLFNEKTDINVHTFSFVIGKDFW